MLSIIFFIGEIGRSGIRCYWIGKPNHFPFSVNEYEDGAFAWSTALYVESRVLPYHFIKKLAYRS